MLSSICANQMNLIPKEVKHNFLTLKSLNIQLILSGLLLNWVKGVYRNLK